MDFDINNLTSNEPTVNSDQPDQLSVLFGESENNNGNNSSKNSPFEETKPFGMEPPSDITEAEKARRAMQSKLDRAMGDMQKGNQAIELLAMFDSDEEFRKAMITKYYPEVFKSSSESIKETLKKEFGDNFETTLESGTSLEKMEIQDRYRELKNRSTASVPKSLDELINERKSKSQKQSKLLEDEINEAQHYAREKLGTANVDELWQEYVKWAPTLKHKDLFAFFVRAKNAKATKTTQSSPFQFQSNQPVPGQNLMNDMASLFGKKQEGIF